MINEWITINGKRVLWDEFIYALDNYRRKIKKDYNGYIHERYCSMICPIQEMAEIYHNQTEWPAKYALEELNKNGFPELKKSLPEAIEKAFDYMVKNLNIDLSEMLTKCAAKSIGAYQKKAEAEKIENKRLATAGELSSQVRKTLPQSEIDFLIHFQKKKDECSEYAPLESAEKEWQITSLLCQIIVCRNYTQYTPYDILEKAYELDLIERSQIDDMLEANGYTYGYRTYSVDFEGDYLFKQTIIPLSDFCEACKSEAEKILGTKTNLS